MRAFAVAFALLCLAMPGFAEEDPKALVAEMVEKVGGMDTLHAKKHVTYRYIYQRPDGKRDVSLEQYVFDGELSRATYSEAGNLGATGKVVQGFDGEKSWVTLDGALQDDEQMNNMAHFLRKTNYYWFAMMHKLMDPGLTYAYEGTRKVEGIDYHLVRVGFGENVGDAQDIYLLYINPYTQLVDQFLFTVMAFGREEPLLMKVDYETVDGVILPCMRRYAPADWDGNVEDDWTLEIMQDIRFDTGLDRTAFTRPK